MRIWLFLACDITIASAINMCMTIVHPSLTQNELRTPLDLSAFSCQQISVSFVVVSKYNISQYSPRSQICVPGCKYMHTSLTHVFYCHSLPRRGFLLLLHNYINSIHSPCRHFTTISAIAWWKVGFAFAQTPIHYSRLTYLPAKLNVSKHTHPLLGKSTILSKSPHKRQCGQTTPPLLVYIIHT